VEQVAKLQGRKSRNVGLWAIVFGISLSCAGPVLAATVTISSPAASQYTGPFNIVCDSTASDGKYITNTTAYLDGSQLVGRSCPAGSASCSYDYLKVAGSLNQAVQGTHTVYCAAQEGTTWVQSPPISFTVDRTPPYTITGPIGNVSKIFKVTGNVSFFPLVNPPISYGSVQSYIDGVQFGSAQSCTTQNCSFSLSGSMPNAGAHVLRVDVATYIGPRVSSYRTINVDTIPLGVSAPDIPNAPSTNVCWNSTTNVMTGNVSHEQTLFTGNTESPLSTSLQLFYNSRDEQDIPTGTGRNFGYKLPLGQGWTHSYDISLFKNPDNTMVLKGGSQAKRFYTPSGSTFLPQKGDFSVLVRNANYTYTLTERSGTKYQFNSVGVLASVSDRYGNIVTFVDNGATANKTVTVTDPSGRATRFLYDSNNEKILTVSDPDSQNYDFTYDAASGLLVKVTYPAPTIGAARPVWPFAYNSYRLLSSKTDPSGNIVSYSYDPTTHMVSGSTNPTGSKTMASAGGAATLTEENGGIWSYAYDGAARVLTGQTGPDGSSTTYAYNTAGFLGAEAAPVDATTSYVKEYQYDSYGNITGVQGHSQHTGPPSVDDAVDSDYSFTYDNANYDQITSITNNLDSPPTVTSLAYSLAGGYNQVLVTDPAGSQTITRLNPKGTVHDTTEPTGAVTSFAYDSASRLVSATSPSGVTKQFGNFTGKGFPQTVTILDATGAVKETAQIVYDASGKVLSQSVPGSLSTYTTNFEYDANGNASKVTDANGNATNVVSDFRGQSTVVTDAPQKSTQMTFETCAACGTGPLMNQLTDANGNATAFVYDQVGRVSKETDPLGKAIRYTYYPSGQVWQKIEDASGNVLIVNVYDSQNRITGRSYLDGSWDTFTYTAGGRLATATNQNIGYTFVYDTMGRIQTVTDSNAKVVTYTYNAAGLRSSVIALSGTPDQHTVSYGYTTGRLSSLTSSLAGAFGFGYDTLGRRSAFLQNSDININNVRPVLTRGSLWSG